MLRKMVLSLLTVCASLSASPKAIVLDFGGVMTTEPKREAVAHFLQTSFNLSSEEFEAVNQERRKAAKAGKSDVEFWLQYAKRQHIILPKDWTNNFNKVMKDAIGVNLQMYALVAELKARNIPVALLSNIDARLGKLLRDFGLYDPFTPCLLSYEIGFEKPDPQIYHVLLKKMDLPASDIIFIDDKVENIEIAKNLGFDAILFTSQEQLQKELSARGVMSQTPAK